MKLKNRKAFTMLELIFVIVVIGILSAIAIPKFAMTKDTAVIAKAKSTVSAIRSAVATERQQRQLRGTFDNIDTLSVQTGFGANKLIFEAFDLNTSNPVLEYPLEACETATSKGCWMRSGTAGEYIYNLPLVGSVIFELDNNRFNCKTPTDANCKLLTR